MNTAARFLAAAGGPAKNTKGASSGLRSHGPSKAPKPSAYTFGGGPATAARLPDARWPGRGRPRPLFAAPSAAERLAHVTGFPPKLGGRGQRSGRPFRPEEGRQHGA